jgi:putative CocE/NonD family hydrolase
MQNLLKRRKYWSYIGTFTLSFLLSVWLAFGNSIYLPTLAQNPAGYPRNQALYVTMRDGVKIAIDVWLPKDLSSGTQIPAIMRATRYWRAVDWIDDNREANPTTTHFLPVYSQDIDTFNQAGYAVVLVDTRGTGASFGTVSVPYSPEEVKDYSEIVNWIVSQPWSNQKVGAYGISYDGNTAEMLAVNNNPAVKAIVPQFNDFDSYAHLLFPGGILNEGFLKGWSQSNKLFDLSPCSFAQAEDICKDFKKAGIIGVKPVDEDKDRRLLAEAIQQHFANVDVYEAAKQITYRDDSFGQSDMTIENISPYNFKKDIERSNVAIYSWGSWLDAGTAEGVLNRFMSFKNHQKAIIGPWTHGAYKQANPYLPPDSPVTPSREEQLADIVNFFDTYLKDSYKKPKLERELKYYTLAEDKWKTTKVWPPVGTKNQRWFLGANNSLTIAPPTQQSGEDNYTVNFEATTGKDTRWAQNYDRNNYPDRSVEDQKILTYTSDVLKNDVEITGNPVVTLYSSSNANDGAFYVYLEDVDENGKVIYITEGQLRPLHRKISNQAPPYVIFGPYHSFKQKDGLPLEPGKVNELSFNLLPTSVLVKKGHRIRVAIAGHDRDSFVRLPAEGTPEISVQRNVVYASYIDLPVMRGK